MLYKDLKSQISEADAPIENTNSTEIKPGENQATKKRIPQKVVQVKKDTTDGVGSETYMISNEITKNLDTVLRRYYNISRVSTNKNTITLSSDLSKLVDNKITDRRTTSVVPRETLLSTIQQIITAELGKKINDFNLVGPQEVAPGVFIITIVPV